MRGPGDVLPAEENNKGSWDTGVTIYNYGGGRAAGAGPDYTRPCDVNIMETNVSAQTIAVRSSPGPPTPRQANLGWDNSPNTSCNNKQILTER